MTAVSGQEPVEFAEPGHVMRNALLEQHLPLSVEETDLMEGAAPVDAGEDLTGRRTACHVDQRCSLEAVSLRAAGLVGTSSRHSWCCSR